MLKQLLVLGVMIGIARSIALAQFGPADLTKEDIISLYEVPIEKTPYHKFEWVFEKPRYIRFVVEESAPHTADWRVTYAVPYRLAVRKGIIIWGIKDVSADFPRKAWLLELRLGGEGENLHGWSGSRLWLPAPQRDFQSTSNTKDPGELFTVTASDCKMRFRLESADKPMESIWLEPSPPPPPAVVAPAAKVPVAPPTKKD